MLLALLFGLFANEPLRILSPTAGVFTGQTILRLEADFDEEDVLGLEVLANDQQVAYFEAPPYDTEVDFRQFPAGDMELKAILTLFDGRHFETSVAGTNHPDLYEEEVNLVRVPVLATGDVTQRTFGITDFQVKENGAAQKLERVLSVEQPLELLILLDVSGSMDKRLMTVRRGIQKLLDSLKPEDRVQIIGFNNAVFEVFPPGTDKDKALKSLNQLSAQGETNLHGALWSGVKTLSKVHLRRALILFTDGRHELTQQQPHERDIKACLLEAQKHGVPIYTMGTGAGIDPEVLAVIAESTGGKFFRLRGSKATHAAFEEVGRQLRQQYLVCYQTRSLQTGWHQIQVELKDEPSAVLRFPSRLYIRRSR